MDYQYHQTVRQTIEGLDRLLVTLLLQGTAFILAVLGISGGLQNNLGPNISFFVTIPLFVLSLFLIFAVHLYSGLLSQAVTVAKEVEARLPLGDEPKLRLTSMMDTSLIAGGRYGPWLYVGCSVILAVVTGIVSAFYGLRWAETGFGI